MHLVAEGISIVVVGAWNAAIFTPDWICGRLTEVQEVGLELPLNNPALPPRFVFDEIFLRTHSDRLVLAPQKATEELLKRIQGVAIRILCDLPHTPVRAVGFNLRFDEPSPTGRLLQAFNLSDDGHLADAGAKIRTTSIKRGMEIEGQLLNCVLEFRENDQVRVEFNFHRDVPDSKAATEFLEAGILNLLSRAVTLLKSAYDIDEIHEMGG